jgi:hypothetical protein
MRGEEIKPLKVSEAKHADTQRKMREKMAEMAEGRQAKATGKKKGKK